MDAPIAEPLVADEAVGMESMAEEETERLEEVQEPVQLVCRMS